MNYIFQQTQRYNALFITNIQITWIKSNFVIHLFNIIQFKYLLILFKIIILCTRNSALQLQVALFFNKHRHKIRWWNVNRLTNAEFEQINHLLTLSSPQIYPLFLIGTFLKPKIPDSVFEIPGFVMYKKDRPGVKWGGGILAYVTSG